MQLAGMKVGYWQVGQLAEVRLNAQGKKIFMYECRCICGKERIHEGSNLEKAAVGNKRGTRSCGCKRSHMCAETKRKKMLARLARRSYCLSNEKPIGLDNGKRAIEA